MGHSLLVNLQYSKNMGVQRLNAQPTTTPATVTPPEVKKNDKRCSRKVVNYFEK
jgi:hypothetical protein